jgi:hypothetical protein
MLKRQPWPPQHTGPVATIALLQFLPRAFTLLMEITVLLKIYFIRRCKKTACGSHFVPISDACARLLLSL